MLRLLLDVSNAVSRHIKHYESPAFGGRNDLTDEEKVIWANGYNVGFGNGIKNGVHQERGDD